MSTQWAVAERCYWTPEHRRFKERRRVDAHDTPAATKQIVNRARPHDFMIGANAELGAKWMRLEDDPSIDHARDMVNELLHRRPGRIQANGCVALELQRHDSEVLDARAAPVLGLIVLTKPMECSDIVIGNPIKACIQRRIADDAGGVDREVLSLRKPAMLEHEVWHPVNPSKLADHVLPRIVPPPDEHGLGAHHLTLKSVQFLIVLDAPLRDELQTVSGRESTQRTHCARHVESQTPVEPEDAHLGSRCSSGSDAATLDWRKR